MRFSVSDAKNWVEYPFSAVSTDTNGCRQDQREQKCEQVISWRVLCER